MGPDYYEVLQVFPNADTNVIQAAYKRLALKYHPDRNHDPGAHEKMRLLNEAYETLSEPERRRAYDDQRRRAEPASQTPRERPGWNTNTDANHGTRAREEPRKSQPDADYAKLQRLVAQPTAPAAYGRGGFEPAMGKPLLGGAQALLGTAALACAGGALLLSLFMNVLTFVTPPQTDPYIGWLPALGLVGLLLTLGPVILLAGRHGRTKLLREGLTNPPVWTGIIALALILYCVINFVWLFVWFLSLLDPASNPDFRYREPFIHESVKPYLDVQRLRAFTSGWMALYWAAMLSAYEIRRAGCCTTGIYLITGRPAAGRKHGRSSFLR